MPESSDNANKPAPAGVASAAAPTGSADTGSEQAAETPSPNYEAQITALNESMATLRKETTNQRSLHDRQMARMRAEMAPPASPPTYVQPGQAQTEEAALATQINQKFASSDQVQADLAYQTAINTFKVDNAGWGDDWDEMQAILGDDAQVANVAVYRQDGTVDYGKTLSFTRNMVQNAKYGAARAKADAERATLEAGRASRQEQAVISGSAGYALPEGVEAPDASKHSPKEMIDKGMYAVNPNDPPTFD